MMQRGVTRHHANTPKTSFETANEAVVVMMK